MIILRKFQYTFSQENVSYIFRNMTTYILQSDINGSLETSNVPNWNPPLWTLSYEVFCYFLLFILIWTLKSRYFIFIKVFLPTLIGIYLCRELLLSIPIKINMVIYYASFFLGSFLYLKKAYLKYHLFTFLILLSLLSFLIPRNIENAYFDNQDFVLGLFLVPLSIFLSFNPKVTINLKNDYSFGIYIFRAYFSIIDFDF